MPPPSPRTPRGPWPVRPVAAAAPGRRPLRRRTDNREQAAHLWPAHHRRPGRYPGAHPGPALRRSHLRALHAHAHGQDLRTVRTQPVAKSLGAERTFEHDVLDPIEHRRALLCLAEEVAARLRDERQAAGGLVLSVRYIDRSVSTRSRTLAEATAHTRPLATTGYELYDLLGLQRARVRALGLRAQDCAPRPKPPGRSPSTRMMTAPSRSKRSPTVPEPATDPAPYGRPASPPPGNAPPPTRPDRTGRGRGDRGRESGSATRRCRVHGRCTPTRP
ncbi:DinB/UmuC family translesion DNA polymerase [Streptomyces sp. NPDC054949]